MIENIEYNNNGIVSIELYGTKYIFWTHSDVVRSYIKDHLRKRFPGKLIVRELNRIDYTIPEENLPIEIQSTISQGKALGIAYANWEKAIRHQIEQNIINYDKCWFFFDSALLTCMQKANKSISINMDWFRKFMKEEKLRVFTVSCDGIIKEKEYKDFDFLAKISQTCPIAAETDDIILNRNKMKIYANTVRLYRFTQDEIDVFEGDFEKYRKINNIDDTDRITKISEFLIKQTDKRSRLYGYILVSIGKLSDINRVFGGNIVGNRILSYGVHIGIFESEGITGKNRMRFVDYPESSRFFPAYLRHKEKWDEFKEKWLTSKQFEGIIKGDVDYNWYKKCENINNDRDQIGNDKEIRQSQNDDKEVNIKIDNKDHTINININAKQKTIEDAWS